ncbi:MAG: hypothetical protein FWF92_07655 [Oscillospiraceae bacterium]|nr:hypothetical protein [Oscillospiraceae bacterium]
MDAAKKYQHNNDGLMNAINDFGGASMLAKAQATLNKNPMAKILLKGMGADIDKITAQYNNSNKNANPVNRNNANNNTSSYKDRLKKLK